MNIRNIVTVIALAGILVVPLLMNTAKPVTAQGDGDFFACPPKTDCAPYGTFPSSTPVPSTTTIDLQSQLVAMQAQLVTFMPMPGTQFCAPRDGRCATYAELLDQNENQRETNELLGRELQQARDTLSRYEMLPPLGNAVEGTAIGYTFEDETYRTQWYNITDESNVLNLNTFGQSYWACYVAQDPLTVGYGKNEVCRHELEWTGTFTRQQGWSWMQIYGGVYGEKFVSFRLDEPGRLNTVVTVRPIYTEMG